LDVSPRFDDVDDCGANAKFFTAWASQLDALVKDNGVDYASYFDDDLTVARQQLRAQLADLDFDSLNSQERFALWIDVYNAIILFELSERFEEDFLYIISDSSFEIFFEKVHNVAGVTLSLGLIENVILKGDREYPLFTVLPEAEQETIEAFHEAIFPGAVDPRLHFAVHFGNRTGANLATLPWWFPATFPNSTRFDERLEEHTRVFLNDSTKGASSQGISQLFSLHADSFDDIPAFIREFGVGDANTDELLPWTWALDHAQ